MTTEKEAIRVWDYTRSDFDYLVKKVNLMLAEGWRLTHMEKVTSDQEVEISFEREIPEPASGRFSPTLADMREDAIRASGFIPKPPAEPDTTAIQEARRKYASLTGPQP